MNLRKKLMEYSMQVNIYLHISFTLSYVSVSMLDQIYLE